jgi:hypothetical protein
MNLSRILCGSVAALVLGISGCAVASDADGSGVGNAGSLDTKLNESGAELASGSVVLRSPFVGSTVEPTNALYALSRNSGFSEVANTLRAITAGYPDVVAFGEQETKGSNDIYRVHYYSKAQTGALLPIGVVTGSLTAGDEFTESVPGSVVFERAPGTSSSPFAQTRGSAPAPRAVFAGFSAEPTNSLSMIRGNRRYAEVAISVIQLTRTQPTVVALGEQISRGATSTFVTHFYLRTTGGTLVPIAVAQGSLIGGDEFTASKPGIASFRALPASAQ